MFGLRTGKWSAAGPRVLLSLSLLLGGMGGIVGRGTLAFFTSSVVSPGHAFQGGIVDITGSSLPTTTVFSWNTTGAGTSGNCADIFSGGVNTGEASQAMVPGMYCVAPVAISNANTNSVDAWMRIRLARSNGSSASATAANEALNDRLKFYMSEYKASSGTAQALQTADCTPSSFKPTWGTLTGGTGAYTNVFGTSVGQIANGSVSGASSTGTRVALTSLSEPDGSRTGIGRNIGANPGVSAVTPRTSNDASSAINPNSTNANSANYGASQATDVLALVNATGETAATTGTFGSTSLSYVPTSANGLRLFNGTSSGATATLAPTEANMNTAAGASRNSFNLAGNDEVTNPVKTGSTTANGTEPHGANAEAEILKGTTRYYCVGVFFPSDTDKSATTVYAQSAIGNGTVLSAYYANSRVTGSNGLQWADCRSTASPLPSGNSNCSTFTNNTITGANGLGDDLASLGNLTYYLTVTASQKAGRTAP